MHMKKGPLDFFHMHGNIKTPVNPHIKIGGVFIL